MQFPDRYRKLRKLREKPELVEPLRQHYRDHPIDLIADWGVTIDPRHVSRKLPPLIAFEPWPRQIELLEWMLEMFYSREFGLSDKSRDVGASWCAVALVCALAVTQQGFAAGFGSRKEDLIDRAGDPKTLFWKIRQFLAHLPAEFRGGWTDRNRAASQHMLITIPATGSTIAGEAGINIGRGGRTSLYVVDEAAFLQNPLAVDAALLANTECRIDLSSVNGMDNPFAEKRWSWEPHRIFTFHWRDDPRKDDAWYEKQKRNVNPLIVASEIDLDYSASKSGVVIPGTWVQFAIGAAEKLGVKVEGVRTSALDVADEGIDLNAWGYRHGIELQYIDAWSGHGSTIFKTTERAFLLCDEHAVPECRYDADGLGVGVRGDAQVINGRPNRENAKRKFTPFQGSGAVVNPDAFVFPGDDRGVGARTNADFFFNAKAQGWWSLRTRFEKTYRAIAEGAPINADEIISISPKLDPTTRQRLIAELSQPTYDINTTGKLLIDKAPDGTKSPNYADCVMILYAPREIRSSIFDAFGMPQ